MGRFDWIPPQVHLGPCSSVGMRPGTDRHTQTDRHTDGRDQYTFRLGLATPHAKCNEKIAGQKGSIDRLNLPLNTIKQRYTHSNTDKDWKLKHTVVK